MTEIRDADVVEHLQWCRARSLAANSMRAKVGTLGRLCEWAGRPLLTLTGADIGRWWAERSADVSSRTGEALTSSTRRVELAHVRTFYQWAHRGGRIGSDPTIAIVSPPPSDPNPNPIPARILADAIADADPQTAAVLALAGLAGLRACEVAALTWEDIAAGGGKPFLRVRRSKGGKSRSVPVSPELLEVLTRLQDDDEPSGPIVRRADRFGGGHVSSSRVSHIGGEYLRARGLSWSMNHLRHGYATRLYEATRDVVVVAAALGHASPAVTMHYLRLRPIDAWDDMVAAGSLGRAS